MITHIPELKTIIYIFFTITHMTNYDSPTHSSPYISPKNWSPGSNVFHVCLIAARQSASKRSLARHLFSHPGADANLGHSGVGSGFGKGWERNMGELMGDLAGFLEIFEVFSSVFRTKMSVNSSSAGNVKTTVLFNIKVSVND